MSSRLPSHASVDLDGNQQHRRGSYSLGRAPHTLGQALQVADLMLGHVFERKTRAFELGADRGRARRHRAGVQGAARLVGDARDDDLGAGGPPPPPRPRSASPRRGCRPDPAPTRPRQARRGRPRRPRPPAVLDAQPSRPRQSMVEGRSSSEGEPVASANPDPVALGGRQDGRAGKARTASTRRRRVGASGAALDSPHGPASPTTRCGTGRGVTCRPRGDRPCLSLPPRSAKRAGSAQAREGTRTAALLSSRSRSWPGWPLFLLLTIWHQVQKVFGL